MAPLYCTVAQVHILNALGKHYWANCSYKQQNIPKTLHSICEVSPFSSSSLPPSLFIHLHIYHLSIVWLSNLPIPCLPQSLPPSYLSLIYGSHFDYTSMPVPHSRIFCDTVPMFHIYTLDSVTTSHIWAIQHLKCSQCDWGSEFELFNFNKFEFISK